MTSLRSISLRVAVAVALLFSLRARAAAAQPLTATPEADEAAELPPLEVDKSAQLDPAPGISFGLGAYGGFAVHTTRDSSRSHGIAGALARLRASYFQLGAVLELSDTAEDRWRSLGGFAGVWLPFRNWVDLEFDVGAASRRYLTSNRRYGPGGYDIGLPALTFRAGVSDRSSEGILGARLGCDLLASFDLDRKRASWNYVVEAEDGPRAYSGRSRLGGFTWGLVLTAAFDVGIKPRRVTQRAEASRAALPTGAQ